MRGISQSIKLGVLLVSVSAVVITGVRQVEASSIPIGRQNEATNTAHEILYGLHAAADDTLGDDSKLQNIILKEIVTWEFVKELGGFDNPHQTPHLNPCPSHQYSLSYQESTGWEKTFSTTTSSTVTSTLGAEFQGIGSELQASYTISMTVGTTNSHTTTLSKNSEPFDLQAGAHADFYLKEYHVEYKGTYDWFEDTTGFGGVYHTGIPWSVAVHYKNDLMGPYITGGWDCPEPSSFVVLATIGMGVMVRRKG